MRGIFNIIHYDTVVKIDFIIRKDSPYRKLEFDRRISKQIGDYSLWVVSPEDLIISKLYWARESGSEVQIGDVKSILAHQGEKLDLGYIEYWVGEMGVSDLWEKVNNA